MHEKLTLGSVPSDEPCAQIGEDGYAQRARRECAIFRKQLERCYADAHEGLSPACQLVIVSNSHDFGTYYEVAAKFDPQKEEEIDAAFWLEHNAPPNWDSEARAVLDNLKVKDL